MASGLVLGIRLRFTLHNTSTQPQQAADQLGGDDLSREAERRAKAIKGPKVEGGGAGWGRSWWLWLRSMV